MTWENFTLWERLAILNRKYQFVDE